MTIDTGYTGARTDGDRPRCVRVPYSTAFEWLLTWRVEA